ncbi:Fe-only nitrogenase accessory AnfO family protein [Methanosarcina barkeri]|nr:Fe-only nitrogenase accessory AnfO family protein [Methanosarcina barkeri]
MESFESFRKKVCNENSIPAIRMAVEDTVKHLEEVLLENPDLSLKKVLILYLKNGEFNRLDVICSHVPKWFNIELEVLGFI